MNINFYDLFLNKFLMSIFFAIGGFVIYTFLSLLIDRFAHRIDPDAPYGLASFDQRVFSLSALLKSSVKFILIFFVIALVLLQFNIQSWAVLILSGLVLWGGTFWMQELVRDFAKGFFIFFENQYQVGDEIQINGITGKVEKMTLRVTFLRGVHNEQIIFPHNAIKEIVNLSKGALKGWLEIGFRRREPLDRVKLILEKSLEDFYQTFSSSFEEKPRIAGPGKYLENYFFIRIEFKTQAKDRPEIENNLKKTLIDALEKEDIFFILNLA
jgi:small conductance mechanosensitive channel